MSLDTTVSPFELGRLTRATPTTKSPSTPNVDSYVRKRLDMDAMGRNDLSDKVDSAHAKIAFVSSKANEAQGTLKGHAEALKRHENTLKVHEGDILDVSNTLKRTTTKIASDINAKIVPALTKNVNDINRGIMPTLEQHERAISEHDMHIKTHVMPRLDKNERDIHEHDQEDREFKKKVEQLQRHSDEGHATVSAMQREVSQLQDDVQMVTMNVQRDGKATKQAIGVMMKADGALMGLSKRLAALEMRVRALEQRR